MNPPDKTAISDWLRESFSFSRDEFSSPITWIDGVGVSRVRDLPDGLASLYKIGINEEELNKDSSRKFLSISVSHGKKILEGISLGSEWNVSDPVDFNCRNEFSLDIQDKSLFQKDKKISPEKLLKILEDRHMQPTKIAAGFFLRCYLWFWRVFLPNFVRCLDFLLLAILWIISGETLQKDILSRSFDGMRTESARERIQEQTEFRFKNVKTMDFFGYYKARQWSVVFYCLAHLILFVIFSYYSIHNSVVETLFENNFTALCYVVVSFAIIETLVPEFLKYSIRKTSKLYGRISFIRLSLWD